MTPASWRGEDRELLRSVASDADRLNRLVGNVLDLARVNAGAMELNLVDADILEVLGVVLNRVRPLAERPADRRQDPPITCPSCYWTSPRWTTCLTTCWRTLCAFRRRELAVEVACLAGSRTRARSR